MMKNVLACIVLGACAAQGDSDPALEQARELCREETLRYGEWAAVCYPEEDVMSAIDMLLRKCDTYTPDDDFRSRWTTAFRTSMNDCIFTIDCDKSDDPYEYCLPEVLQANADGLIDTNLLAACTTGVSEDCIQAVSNLAAPARSIVEQCLVQWNACQSTTATSNGAWWPMDNCTTLIALQQEFRDQAATCLDLPCGDTLACLRDAGTFDL